MDFQDIIDFINSISDNIILLFPIGPPGSGKTTLKQHLLEQITNRTIISPSRDIIFHKYRQNYGIKKSKHLTHNEMVDQITKTKHNTNQKYLIYIDSTNSNPYIRKIYIDLINPNITKYICFHTKHLNDPINYLVNRTHHRKHPTFPIEKEEQIKKIKIILNTIEYPIDNQNNFNIYI